MVLVMLNGRQQAFGPKEQVLQPPQQQQPAAMPGARMIQPMTVHAGGRPQEKAP
jgi:ATP-binding cassette subfamily C protein